MRVLALLAVHNEERFVGACIRHLARNGVETYVIDNASTDRTLEIAANYEGHGLAGLETMPRNGVYQWRSLLARKAALAESLEANWFLHVDADEIRLAPRSSVTLAEALAEVDADGYNAVNFQEFTFVPTREAPEHDHARFQETMRHYYPFLPESPHRLNAWKCQDGPVDLVTSGGHRVWFPNLRMFPLSFPMRHYLFLSVEHARRKYGARVYAPREVAAGWHGPRVSFAAEEIELLPAERLRVFTSDEELDASAPWKRHPLFDGPRRQPRAGV